MNDFIKTDENGHIIINDSMSDELKEKIAIYNNICDKDDADDESNISDDEIDNNDNESVDDNASVEEPVYQAKEVSEEELNSLNDMFN